MGFDEWSRYIKQNLTLLIIAIIKIYLKNEDIVNILVHW